MKERINKITIYAIGKLLTWYATNLKGDIAGIKELKSFIYVQIFNSIYSGEAPDKVTPYEHYGNLLDLAKKDKNKVRVDKFYRYLRTTKSAEFYKLHSLIQR